MQYPHKFLLLLPFLIFSKQFKAQSCGSCSLNITGYDTLVYVINSGQILCIDSTGQFDGSITLNGGTLCNKGIFNPKTFSLSSGTLTNYAIARFNGSVALNVGLVFNNNSPAAATIEGSLTISGGSLNNSGVVNIQTNLLFSSGTLNNSALVNCHVLSGAAVAAIINTGVINKD
jgi:adhesin HecA-like repeat protein